MDTKPRIALVWPYGVKGAESIPIFLSFLVPRLTDISHVLVSDCSLNQLHPGSVRFAQLLTEFAPDIIGISSWSQNWTWTRVTVAMIRQILPKTVIVTGGPHVTATGDLGWADYALLGEAEWSFRELVLGLAAGASQADLEQRVPGLRCANQQTTTPQALVADLDALGLPNFEAMLLAHYQASGYQYRNGAQKQAPILATRGCPYTCAFCEAPMLSGRKIRKHSIPYLQELLAHLRQDFATEHINIVDDNFTFHVGYAKEFCEMVLQHQDRLGGMTFATPNGIRVERSDGELFRLMKAAGWERLIFAPESGSQRMVTVMAKHLDLDVVAERTALAQAAGLEVEAFFILNYPGETDADVHATRDFIATVGFDHISLHIFKPLPHTPIWRELVSSGLLAPEYVIGRYDEVDWLANNRSVEDIRQHIALYTEAAQTTPHLA